jgi:DNA-binding SARP family transcriptional activator
MAREWTTKEQPGERLPVPQVRVWLCGPLTLERRAVDGPWHPLDPHVWGQGRAARSLLARLLLAPQRRLSRSQLCEDLWPDSRDSAAERLLYNAAHRLRRVLGPALLQTWTQGYKLAGQDLLWCDWEACQQTLRAAEHQGPTRAERLPGLEEVLGWLERGALAEEEGGIWVYGLRAQAEAMRRQCRRWLARGYARQGTPWLASEQYRALLAEDVADEESLREWVSLWLAQGQEREARRCYEEGRALAAQQGETVPPWEQLRLVKVTPDMVCLTQREHASEEARSGLAISAVPARQPGGLGPTASLEPTLPTLPLSVGSPLWFVWQQRRVEALLVSFQERWRDGLELTAWAELCRHLQEELATVPPQEHDRDYTISRRQLLLALATLPLSSVGVILREEQPRLIEPFLSSATAGIAACRALMHGRDWPLAEAPLLHLVPALETLAARQHTSAIADIASRLLIQIHWMLAYLAWNRLDSSGRFLHLRSALQVSRRLGDASLLIALLGYQMNTFTHARQPDRAQLLLQEATRVEENASPLARTVLLSSAALAYAQQGRARETYTVVDQLQEQQALSSEEDPLLVVIEGRPFLPEAKAYLELARGLSAQGRPDPRLLERAWNVLTALPWETLSLRVQVETMIWQARLALAQEDLERCAWCLLQAAQEARVLQSDRRLQELRATWQEAKEVWPHERRLLELAEVLLQEASRS